MKSMNIRDCHGEPQEKMNLVFASEGKRTSMLYLMVQTNHNWCDKTPWAQNGHYNGAVMVMTTTPANMV
jgi:hypothetical protein